jgi:hypothetical protein
MNACMECVDNRIFNSALARPICGVGGQVALHIHSGHGVKQRSTQRTQKKDRNGRNII